MSDTSIGATFEPGQGQGSIDLRAELSRHHFRDNDSRGCPPSSGWWVAVVVLGGTAGWVRIITALVT